MKTNFKVGASKRQIFKKSQREERLKMSEDKCCNTKVLLVTGGYDNSISLNRLSSTEVKTCFVEIDKQ